MQKKHVSVLNKTTLACNTIPEIILFSVSDENAMKVGLIGIVLNNDCLRLMPIHKL